MVNYLVLAIAAVILTGCAMSMTPSQFMKKLPNSTQSEFYNRTDANEALASRACKLLVTNRRYASPLGLTVDQDLSNGAKGIDEWVQLDGGNAFSLNNFEWIDVIDGTQLIVYFDTMICEKIKPRQIGV